MACIRRIARQPSRHVPSLVIGVVRAYVSISTLLSLGIFQCSFSTLFEHCVLVSVVAATPAVSRHGTTDPRDFDSVTSRSPIRQEMGVSQAHD